MVWGSIISAAGSVLGGLLQGRQSADNASDIANMNAQLQREFAQNGIRWRVEDAQKAGIHPLYALGAQTTGYQPTVAYDGGGGGLGAGLAAAGQDIGRAIDATRTKDERYVARMEALQLERAELENDKLRSEIARITQQTGPAMPSARLPSAMDGQGDFALPPGSAAPLVGVEVKPVEVPATRVGHPELEAGMFPTVRFHRGLDGGYQPMPPDSPALSDPDITNPFALEWIVRNRILPTIDPKGLGNPPPMSELPPWASHWEWSRWDQEWQPALDTETRGGEGVKTEWRRGRRKWLVPIN